VHYGRPAFGASETFGLASSNDLQRAVGGALSGTLFVRVLTAMKISIIDVKTAAQFC
jgi:hypothetical protein